MTKVKMLCVLTCLVLAVVLPPGAEAQSAAHPLPKVARNPASIPVTLTDNGNSWTLDNGIVKITVGKRDGNLSSIVYHGVEVLTQGSYSYWEQKPAGSITARVTIDPAANGGERAEVSVKGVNPGSSNSSGPLDGSASVPRAPGSAGIPGGPRRASGRRGPGGRGGMDLEAR